MHEPTKFEISKDDIKRANIKNILSNCAKKDCSEYNRLFAIQRDEAAKSNDLQLEKIFDLLEYSFFFHLRTDHPNDPFEPLFSSQPRVSDYTTEHIECLENIIEEFDDPEFKSRIADIIWIKKRDYKHAQLAVKSYINAARNLDGKKPLNQILPRIERALQIAKNLNNQDLKHLVLEYIFFLVKNRCKPEDGWVSCHFLKLLYENGHREPDELNEISILNAIEMESLNSWEYARDLWTLSAKICKDNGKEESKNYALNRCLECYIKDANMYIENKNPNYIVPVDRTKRAIEFARNNGFSSEIIDTLHKKLLEYERKMEQNLHLMEFSIEIPRQITKDKISFIETARSINQALFFLAFITSLVDYNYTYSQAEEDIKRNPLIFLFSRERISEEGKTQDIAPAFSLNEPEKNKEVIHDYMYQTVAPTQQMKYELVINPVRKKVIRKFKICEEDFYPLVFNNRLIPEGKELIFVRGLNAGLHGNYLVALHLLIPQLENSLRYILRESGIVTSSLTQQGIQEERLSDYLLEHPDFIKIFSRDIKFEIECLFTSKSGANIRNRLAHGLIDANEFNSALFGYSWWFILHLCCNPLIGSKDN